MIEYIIPIVVIILPLYGIYWIKTKKDKSVGGGIFTGNALLKQFDNDEKKRAKAEIRYHKEVKKHEAEQGEDFPPDKNY